MTNTNKPVHNSNLEGPRIQEKVTLYAQNMYPRLQICILANKIDLQTGALHITYLYAQHLLYTTGGPRLTDVIEAANYICNPRNLLMGSC